MGGVRVVDLSGLGDLSLSSGEQAPLGGMRQIGDHVTENANTWAVKTPVIERDGDFWIYGNGMNRGLDIYRFEAEEEESAEGGETLSAAAAAKELASAEHLTGSLTTATGERGEQERPRVLCLLKAAQAAGA